MEEIFGMKMVSCLRLCKFFSGSKAPREARSPGVRAGTFNYNHVNNEENRR